MPIELVNLPVEIREFIISHLENKDIAACAVTCRALYFTALRLLHSDEVYEHKKNQAAALDTGLTFFVPIQEENLVGENAETEKRNWALISHKRTKVMCSNKSTLFETKNAPGCYEINLTWGELTDRNNLRKTGYVPPKKSKKKSAGINYPNAYFFHLEKEPSDIIGYWSKGSEEMVKNPYFSK